MRNIKILVVWMCVLVLGIVGLALAQTATGNARTAPDLFGMSATLVTLILGLASSILTAVFKRTNYSTGTKYVITYAVSGFIALGGALLSKQFVGDALTQNLGVTILAVLGAAELVFKFLQNNLLKVLQENVNAGKAAAPALPE